MRREIRVLIVLIVVASLMSGCGELLATKTSLGTEQGSEVAKNQDDNQTNLIKEDEGQKKSEEEQAGEMGTELRNKQIVVQVCGAVVMPGVYEIEEGSRIETAIILAGGLTKEAAYESVNQAETAKDGQMIYVYKKEEYTYIGPPSSDETNDDGTTININRANKEELMKIPGIGEAKAQLIISYREEHGDFSCIEGIMEIDGIKEGLFNQMKDKIEVE